MRTSLIDPKHHAYHTMYVVLLAFCTYLCVAELTSSTESLSTAGNLPDLHLHLHLDDSNSRNLHSLSA